MYYIGRFDNWKPRLSNIIVDYMSMKSGSSSLVNSTTKTNQGEYNRGLEEDSVITLPSVMSHKSVPAATNWNGSKTAVPQEVEGEEEELWEEEDEEEVVT